MKNILAVFGGNSSEHDVSIMSAIEGMEAVPFVDYKVFPIYIKDGVWYYGEELKNIKSYLDFNTKNLKKVTLIGKDLYYSKGKKWRYLDTVDCALLFTHGGDGENGVLQGYFETIRLPYTSSGVLGSSLTMNKWITKVLVKDMGIEVVDGLLIKDNCPENFDLVESVLGFPVFVKPNSQGSSIGVGLARNKDELNEKLKVAFNYDKEVLIEKGMVDFVEYNCAVLTIGERVIVSEIEKTNEGKSYLTFEDKYLSRSDNKFTQNISAELREEIKVKTSEIYERLNLKGVVRFDYIFKDKLYLNEINSIPGSLANHLFTELTYGELLSLLIDDALDRGTSKQSEFSSNILSQGKKK